MNPTVGLVVFLLPYALLGAAFAFNVRSISDRAAAAYRGKPWLLRQIGRDNPAAWRAGGFMMAAFGVAMIAGILLLAVWHPPGISVTAAIVILIPTARRLDCNARAFEAGPPASSAARGAALGMNSLAAEEPDSLFPARRDAVHYLVGLGGFWAGVAVILTAADAALPSLVVVVFSGLAVSCAFLHMNTTRKFEGRLTGRSVRPWPLGYASFRTQVIATLPSTAMAAAQRLQWNAIVVTAAMYSTLVIGLIALVAWPTTR